MKNIFIMLIISLLSLKVSAQSKINNVKLEEGVHYSTTFGDENIKHQGTYVYLNQKLVKDGEWIMRNNNKIVTRAEYRNGKLVWIKAFTKDGWKTATYKDFARAKRDREERMERFNSAIVIAEIY